MKPSIISLAAMAAAAHIGTAATPAATPLALHPENPHCFLFRGRPTLLITSGEHYGAVLNRDFDMVRYLDTLAADGLNHTRIFVGTYCEPAGAFKITGNTLAPAPGRFICPWQRSPQPGYANGGNRFDLTAWDAAYFQRLRSFVAAAGERGIVVEVNLFCPFYRDEMWVLSPLHAANNINGLPQVGRDEVHTLTAHGGLLAVQEAMARKVVAELAEFDNLFFEIMNEPYARKVPLDWQRHLTEVVAGALRELGCRHLISWNIANGKAKVDDPHPDVSILNFHYAWPPDTVGLNLGLGRVIGDNETGFKGNGDFHYRREAWAFLLAGGGLYNNLDYSFAVGFEDGSFRYPETQPGGGSAALRRQLGFLSRFLHGLDLVRLAPRNDLIKAGPGDGLAAFGRAVPGSQAAIYLCRTGAPQADTTARFDLDLPPGVYTCRWLDPAAPGVIREERLDHPGGPRSFATPPFAEDIALEIRR